MIGIKNNINLFVILVVLIIFIVNCGDNYLVDAAVNTKTKIAVITGGSFDDLGFNAVINEGRVKAQRATEILHFDLFSNVHIDTLNDTIQWCVDEGYTGIISLAVEVATQVRLNAAKFPLVKFLAFGSLATTPNLSWATYNIGIMQYVVGYFAGLMTKTGKIGYIAPGEPLVKNYNANALFVGARRSNETAQVLIYNTGDWIIPDVSVGATDQLIAKDIDFLSNNQDDQSANIQMIKRGYFGLGTNGFPQNRIYGEQIAMGVCHNWTQVFIDFANIVITNSSKSFKFYGEFYNGFLYLDKFGFYVPQVVQQKVQDEIKNLSSVPRAQHPYFCNKYNRELYNLNNSIFGAELPANNCLTNSQFFRLNSDYDGMHWQGFYSVPLTRVDVKHSILYGFTITSGVLIALSLVLLAMIGWFRNAHSIRSASPFFSATIIIGGIMTYIGAIIYALPPSNGSCVAKFWMLAIGYALMVGSLVVKNIRIWMIFDNSELRVVKVTNYQLMPWVAGIVAIMVVLLALMTAPAVGDIKMVQVDWRSEDANDLSKYEYANVCIMGRTASIILYVLLGVFGVLMATGVFVSWKIRTVDIEEFNESKPIANTLYAGLFSIFVIISLMISPQSVNNETTIICSAVLFITTISLGILFLPKFIRIYLYGANTSNVFNRSGKQTRSTATGGKTVSDGNLTQFNDEEGESRAAPATSHDTSSGSIATLERTDSRSMVNRSNSQIITKDQLTISVSNEKPNDDLEMEQP
ncbi:G-protein-coupled receptor family 3 protein 4 [Heterostelium album PN500]|uniref:G-protein-coupled receptor family 3 protein 4 n=1 Tax=Heterostelium pallidum (strain ATCC 26659 / Pp 5 / PN500) TaxID=670386 RepID=D3B978_HETP5|nr:G-protein-coupled receptor family 3 protein 4 [Heterostelium album PN500]EFA82117.1 G-protein-coupled receptor family 3 protein 4 [Heterostelium album PN500]|eukprot:XP_020434234.1 G-protein-coupled receptor family 3 protein 4 [Heterostelium album PN500]